MFVSISIVRFYLHFHMNDLNILMASTDRRRIIYLWTQKAME